VDGNELRYVLISAGQELRPVVDAPGVRRTRSDPDPTNPFSSVIISSWMILTNPTIPE
jgi:hypothetical protein